MIPVSIPSPPLDWEILFQVGGFKVHAYALAILLGIFEALWLTRRRWVARGGQVEAMEEIAVWAIPFGIVGGRIYHVISTPGPYFGHDGHPMNAFKIWDGGLGIWGAVAIGAIGALIGARRSHVSFSAFMDAVAPTVLIAQAIGRLGNYFNQELFGKPTTMPWGLSVDPTIAANAGYSAGTLFQPTFLYELLWNLAGAALLLYLDRRYNFRFGRMFWLYVIVYTTGRLWIEMLRIDTAVHPFGLGIRVNVWVAIAVLLLGIGMFLGLGRRHRGEVVEFPARSFAPEGPSVAVDVKVKDKVTSGKVTSGKVASGKDPEPKKAREDKAAVKEPAPKKPAPKKPASSELATEAPAARKPAPKKAAAT